MDRVTILNQSEFWVDVEFLTKFDQNWVVACAVVSDKDQVEYLLNVCSNQRD